MRTIGRPGKNICTLSSHRATRELYAKVPSHRAPVGALCEGSMRIELTELRSELYAALHGSIAVPRSKTAMFDGSFSFSAPRLWNQLPESARKATSLNVFKRNDKEYI